MQRCLVVAAFTLLALTAQAEQMGYSGQQGRDIKALSAEETASLLAGRGMGLAKAGELNHYPGPAHILELRDKLGLTLDQVALVQANFDRMTAAAKALGATLVERERALDDAFKRGGLTRDALANQTAEIGLLQGQLRAIHLAAHLDARAMLTSAQIAAYDNLRGYTGAPANGGVMHHG